MAKVLDTPIATSSPIDGMDNEAEANNIGDEEERMVRRFDAKWG